MAMNIEKLQEIIEVYVILSNEYENSKWFDEKKSLNKY